MLCSYHGFMAELFRVAPAGRLVDSELKVTKSLGGCRKAVLSDQLGIDDHRAEYRSRRRRNPCAFPLWGNRAGVEMVGRGFGFGFLFWCWVG